MVNSALNLGFPKHLWLTFVAKLKSADMLSGTYSSHLFLRCQTLYVAQPMSMLLSWILHKVWAHLETLEVFFWTNIELMFLSHGSWSCWIIITLMKWLFHAEVFQPCWGCLMMKNWVVVQNLCLICHLIEDNLFRLHWLVWILQTLAQRICCDEIFLIIHLFWDLWFSLLVRISFAGECFWFIEWCCRPFVIPVSTWLALSVDIASLEGSCWTKTLVILSNITTVKNVSVENPVVCLVRW